MGGKEREREAFVVVVGVVVYVCVCWGAGVDQLFSLFWLFLGDEFRCRLYVQEGAVWVCLG